jgi:hypothetical protein
MSAETPYSLGSGAPIIFFVKAVRAPTDHNKVSCLVSVFTMLFAGMPFVHLLC